MITFFTTAKPFTGPAARSQSNAIRSWKALHPDVEVLLFGKGAGYEEAAARFGLVHVPEVETNDKGVPLVSSMFSIAQARGRHRLQAYVNCDIILLDDFRVAAQKVDLAKFLMVGQRWDVDLDRELDCSDSRWQEGLRERIRPEMRHPPAGSDYFLYTRGTWGDLPPMVVGRAGYDCWLICHARACRIPVIDASDATTVIHQNHDYGHLSGGAQESWDGTEARRNVEMAGGRDQMFTLHDADFRLTPEGVVRSDRIRRYRGAEIHLILRKGHVWNRLALRGLRVAARVLEALGLKSP